MAIVQTGPVSVAGDWDGVFIRQDEAVAYAFALRSLIESLPQHVECAFLFGLARLLESADGPAARVKLELA